MRGCLTGEHENTGADDGADAEAMRAPGPSVRLSVAPVCSFDSSEHRHGGEDSALASCKPRLYEIAREPSTFQPVLVEREHVRARCRVRLTLRAIFRHVRGERCDQRLVHFRRAGDDVAALFVRLARQRADAAASLLDQQRARGGVPRRKPISQNASTRPAAT